MIFDFLSQSFDVYIYGTGVSDVFVAPDMVQKLFSGEYLVG